MEGRGYVDNLILYMSLSGSITLGGYFLLKFFLREKLTPVCRYILLLIVSFFFVIPIPLFKYALVSVGNYIFPQKWNYILMLNSNPKFLELNKFYAVVDDKILFPNYRNLYKFFLGIWLCCALFIMGREIVAYVKFRRSVNKLDKVGFFPQCLNKYSSNSRWHKIMFCRCRNLKGAFTYGIFRETILLPNSLSDDEERYIIEHELMHVKHHDLLVKIINLFAVVLHFFNPLAYLLMVEMSDVMELYCDWDVLKNYSYEERMQYGHLVISQSEETKKFCRTRSFSNNKKILKERICMIKNYKHLKKRGCIILALLFSVSGVVPVMAYNPPVVIQNENYSVIEDCDWVECDEGDFMYQDSDEITFELVDEYVILENGQILTNDGNEKIGCNHNYVKSTLKKHVSNSSGGCTIYIYSAKVCQICSKIIESKLIDTVTYSKCVHK